MNPRSYLKKKMKIPLKASRLYKRANRTLKIRMKILKKIPTLGSSQKKTLRALLSQDLSRQSFLKSWRKRQVERWLVQKLWSKVKKRWKKKVNPWNSSTAWSNILTLLMTLIFWETRFTGSSLSVVLWKSSKTSSIHLMVRPFSGSQREGSVDLLRT